MLNPIIDIRIKNDAGKILFFDFVVDGEIVSTWQELTKTAKFTLPRKVSQLGDELPNLIQVGNEVVIRLGYDWELVTEFKGYITSIGSKTPVEIECQDLMWILKQTDVNEVWTSVDLETVIKKIVPAGIETQVQNRPMGALRLSKVSVAKVLDKFKDYGITSYVRNGKLYVGTAYNQLSNLPTLKKGFYHFQKTIIDNDLVFKTKKEVKIKIECLSRQNDGKELKYTYPENVLGDAELHTFRQLNGLSKADLKKIAEAEYNKFVYDGFRGHFLTFGSPHLDHGDVAVLEDDFYPEKNGEYMVDKVVVKFGLNGYKREPYLGKRL